MPLPPNLFASSSGTSRQQGAFDDWESAYDRDEQTTRNVDQNVRLWQEANASRTPSYTILPSSASSSASRSTSLPPSAALDSSTTNGPPKLMILKRPTVNNSESQGRSSPGQGGARGEKSLKEREREYAEARRRIYGDSEQQQPQQGQSDGKSKKNGMGEANGRVRSNGNGNSSRGSPRNSNRPSPNSSRSSTPTTTTSNGVPRGGGSSVIRKPKGPNGEGKGFGGKK
ncbi:hypothetical protein JCM3765_007584 [Sporobolomyces pararoseus]